ncbi:MAG: 6-phosphofructokinase [Ignavibacteriales bacterium CG07_land_8_20_14_0_80_59_12]|nr:MAG: 6-phosphofructokinase [Ignavibacteriales bacterium CG07_land_8_20_14_0_80_59_12]
MRRIGVFTSGGDSPGMNAAIRAVVRTGIHQGVEVCGIHRGYAGMIRGEVTQLEARSVSNILQRGGTILKTARSDEFMAKEGRAKAAAKLKKKGIEGLVAIGGDGTFQGAVALNEEHGTPIVGIPGTIDNDLYGTDFTIGYDTAVNTAMEAIDKIRDTAGSHERLFYVEVMGRQSGFIALDVGLTSGAEYIAIPETKTDIDELKSLLKGFRKDKSSAIIVVAEGDEQGGAFTLAKKVKDASGYEYRVCVLGHVQRGGSPTSRDRLLASKLGYTAVTTLLSGASNLMVGEVNGKIVLTPLRETWQHRKIIDPGLIEIASILSL